MPVLTLYGKLKFTFIENVNLIRFKLPGAFGFLVSLLTVTHFVKVLMLHKYINIEILV